MQDTIIQGNERAYKSFNTAKLIERSYHSSDKFFLKNLHRINPLIQYGKKKNQPTKSNYMSINNKKSSFLTTQSNSKTFMKQAKLIKVNKNRLKARASSVTNGKMDLASLINPGNAGNIISLPGDGNQ